jgi:hypothetical protein
LQLDFDFNLLTQTYLIPPPSPHIKSDAIKKVCSTSTLPSTDSSLNRTAANQIVPAEKMLCMAVQRERRLVNSDGALGKMIPQIIIFGYKDYTVLTKKQLQLAKHAGRK